MDDLLANVRWDKVANTTATGTTQIDSAIVDMAGYDHVMFFTTIATANAGNYIQVEQNTANSGSGMAALAGSKVVAAANNDIVAVQVKKPAERYLRCNVVRAGATTVVGEIYALRFGTHSNPQTNNYTGMVSETWNTPAEGAA